MNQTKESFRIYPLSQKDNPPEMTFVNVSGKEFNTIHRMDAEIFNEINAVIQREPLMGERPELLGHHRGNRDRQGSGSSSPTRGCNRSSKRPLRLAR